MIDWTDPHAQVTPHFTVADCLFFRNWYRLAGPKDGVDYDKLLILCERLEAIREILGAPMNVLSCFRSQAYNESQGIHPIDDVHSLSEACDFTCEPNLSTDQVKALLLPKLEELQIRLEDNGAESSWVHVDVHRVISSRFFKP